MTELAFVFVFAFLVYEIEAEFIVHWQNYEMKKVNISWFLLTFSALAVNFMYQLMIEINWFSQLLADY